MLAPDALPPHLKDQRERVSCGLEGPRHPAGFGYSGTFASLNIHDRFSISDLKERLKIEILHLSDDKIVFDLVGADVSLANAIRRILISEVPTVALETVHLYQNTGVIQDEVLVHRLGLIPFKVDPEMISWRKENEDLSEFNALCFKLHVKCTEKDVRPHLNHMPVYASDFKWMPISPAQAAKFASCPPGPVEPTILVTKLRPGQEIELKIFCEKGIGKTHAKWSPVMTAVYRLLPILEFPKGPLTGQDAEDLKETCPMKVFDVEDGVSVASKPRNCTTCRACLERFPNQVRLSKKKDHFIFTVESSGCIPAGDLFEKAVGILRDKASKIKDNLLTALNSAAE